MRGFVENRLCGLQPRLSFRRRAGCVAIAALLVAAVGCARQPEPSGLFSSQQIDVGGQVAGFLLGLFHGFTMVFNIIASLFFDIRIYQFPNAGRLYDLGYVVGAAAFFSGSHSALNGEAAQHGEGNRPGQQGAPASIRGSYSLTPPEIERMISSMPDDERDALKRFAESALKFLPRYRRLWL